MSALALPFNVWVTQHPGSTLQDYQDEQAAERNFNASLPPGTTVGVSTLSPTDPGSINAPPGGGVEGPPITFGGNFPGGGVPPESGSPVNPVGGPGGGPGSTNSTAGNVTVIVNDVNTVTQAVIDEIARAVSNAVSTAARDSISAINAAFGDLKDTLKSIADAIWNGIKTGISALVSQIGNIISGIASNIGNIFKAIVGQIGNILSSIKDTIIEVINKIGPVLDSIAQTVKHINDTLIQPIATFINTTVKTIADLTIAIQRDLHEGLAGIVQIPGQIAGGLASLDASLARTVEQLGQANAQVGRSNIDYLGSTFPGLQAGATKGMLVGSTVKDKITSTFADSAHLAPESLSQVSAEAIQALGPLLSDVLKTIWNVCKSPFDQQHADWSAVENVFIGLLDGVLTVLTTLTAVGALVEPLLEAASEEARSRVPVTKLDVNSIMLAMRRGFLDVSGAASELNKLGFDPTRIKVLQDLQVALVDVATVIDWWYRDIITDEDLAANLSQQGFISTDVQAFKDGSLNIAQLNLVERWWNFGLMDENTLRLYLRKLRWPEEQITAWIATQKITATAAGLSNIDGRVNAAQSGWLRQTLNSDTPQAVVDAGAREGLHPETTKMAWLAHWQLPSVQAAIQTYFRGLRTLTETQAAMQAANLPPEVWDETIQINRPLIPFRSIPTYVKAGYMSEADAQLELAAHGFDLHHINIILKAIGATATGTSAAKAAKIATLSEANARTLFDDGILTEQQYIAVLEQHGYTAELAAAQAQADQINAHIKQRKSIIADMTAQVETGSLTLDDAVSQLQSQGFSNAEISAFQLKIQKFLKTNAKHPSIPEMKTFIKAGYMTLDQFKTELQAQGWLDPWLTMWVQLETPPPPATPATGTP